MSENPFGGGEGLGGFDLGAMLEQAQTMQAQLMEAQAELAQETVEGTAGGSITVRLTGTSDLVAVQVAPGSFDANDTESLADLGDLVVAAYRDAKVKADALAAEKLGPLAGGIGGDIGPGGPGSTGELGFGPAGGSGGPLV